MPSRLAFVLSVITATLFVSTAADARFTVCNQTSLEASLAVGCHDLEDGWVAEGWWNLARGECDEVVAEPLSSSYVHVYVDGDRGSWHARAEQKGGYFCAGDETFMTRNDDFADKDGELSCDDDFEVLQFREVRIGEAENVKLDLTYWSLSPRSVRGVAWLPRR